METVVLVVHLMLAVTIIGLVLLQRSEGGGLGMGGGGMGGLATPQATANALTKATGICAALFFITSLTLGVMSEKRSTAADILSKVDKVPAAEKVVDDKDANKAVEAAKDAAAKAADTAKQTTAPAKEPSVPISK